MNDFVNKNDLVRLVKMYQTPFYLYDKHTILENIKTMKNISSSANLQINYATKANSNIEILKIIKTEGLKVDATGQGEVYVNQKAGFLDDNIYVVGNNFSKNELKDLADKNLNISVDAIDQLRLLQDIAPGYQKVMLRVNPTFGDGENQSIITGGDNHKFGIDYKDMPYAINFIKDNNMKLIGINQHIGSLNLNYLSIVQAVRELLDYVIKSNLDDLEIINFGGGFGINYKRKFNNEKLDFKSLKKSLDDIFLEFLKIYKNKSVSLEFEPGRYIVATSSILVGEVTSIKKRGDKYYVGTDLGFSTFMRPTLYNSYHEVEFITNNTSTHICNVVGNMCESGDYIAKDRELIIPDVGDLVIVHDTGAYGFSMSNNYNNKLRPIEILKDKDTYTVIRKRDELKDLLKGQE